MKKLIKTIHKNQYKVTKKKYKTLIKKWHKKRFTYIPKIELEVGCELWLKGKYYTTVIRESKRIWTVRSKYITEPPLIDDIFLKETISKWGFKVIYPDKEKIS